MGSSAKMRAVSSFSLLFIFLKSWSCILVILSAKDLTDSLESYLCSGMGTLEEGGLAVLGL